MSSYEIIDPVSLFWYDMPRLIYQRLPDGHLFAVQGCDPEHPDRVPSGPAGRWQAIFYGGVVRDPALYTAFRANEITYEQLIAGAEEWFSFDFAQDPCHTTPLPGTISPENLTDGLYYRDCADELPPL